MAPSEERRTTDTEIHELYKRQSETEATLSGLVSTVNTMVTAIAGTNTKLDNLATTQSSNNKFPVAPSIAFAGLMFGILATVVGVLGGTDSRIESALIKMTDRVIDHTSDGHPEVQSAKIAVLTFDLRRVENATVTKEKLAADLLAIRGELTRADVRLTRAEKWDDRHDQVIPLKNSRQDTLDIVYGQRLDKHDEKIDKIHSLLGDIHMLIGKKVDRAEKRQIKSEF